MDADAGDATRLVKTALLKEAFMLMDVDHDRSITMFRAPLYYRDPFHSAPLYYRS